MVGIYAIKNSINEKIYIGRSTDIHRRWMTHLRDAKKGDMCKIHIAMRKLGIDNFYIEVIEECDTEKLNEREQYYIDKFDSWHNGYNNGNSSNFSDGEDNCNAKMTKDEISTIRIRQSKMKENRREIYNDYKDKITWTNFLYICKYLTWPSILSEFNTKEIMDWHKKQLGNESRKFSKEQLEDIIILRYKDKLSYQKIANIFDKNRKTIERIFTGIYYKKEIEELKSEKPYLFQS